MAKDHQDGLDVADFIATVGLRHAYRLSYLTSAIVTPGYDAVKRETSLLISRALRLCMAAFDPPLAVPPGHPPDLRRFRIPQPSPRLPSRSRPPAVAVRSRRLRLKRRDHLYRLAPR